jgi:D-arabinose 1-dehydrogenase-like Zn-dependent alcohol dehydrogenase
LAPGVVGNLCGKSGVYNMKALLTAISIGLPPAGKYHIDLDPTSLVFRNQSIHGTLVAGLQDVDETLDFAKRGMLFKIDSF